MTATGRRYTGTTFGVVASSINCEVHAEIMKQVIMKHKRRKMGHSFIRTE